MTTQKKTFLFFFANSDKYKLPYLEKEYELLTKIVDELERETEGFLFKVIKVDDYKDFKQYLEKYQSTLYCLSFSGHAGETNFMIGDQQINVKDLGHFLKNEKDLKLILLNGCSTEEQAKSMVEHIDAITIATKKPIRDSASFDFAKTLWQSVFGIYPYPHLTIHEAIKRAVSNTMIAPVNLEKKNELINWLQTRYSGKAQPKISNTENLWQIHYQAPNGQPKFFELNRLEQPSDLPKFLEQNILGPESNRANMNIRIPAHHAYECDRVDQISQWSQYKKEASLGDVKAINYYYVHGEERQSHTYFTNRLANDLAQSFHKIIRKDEHKEANANLKSHLENPTTESFPPPTRTREGIKVWTHRHFTINFNSCSEKPQHEKDNQVNLLKNIWLALNVDSSNIKDEVRSISRLFEESIILQKIKPETICFFHFNIPQRSWHKEVVSNLTKWLITDFFQEEMGTRKENLPKIIVIFSIIYTPVYMDSNWGKGILSYLSLRNTKLKVQKEVAESLMNAQHTKYLFPELEFVEKKHIHDWFEDKVPIDVEGKRGLTEPEKYIEREKLKIRLESAKTKHGYYMDDVVAELKNLITNVNQSEINEVRTQ